jgi:hypothetical protein
MDEMTVTRVTYEFGERRSVTFVREVFEGRIQWRVFATWDGYDEYWDQSPRHKPSQIVAQEFADICRKQLQGAG